MILIHAPCLEELSEIHQAGTVGDIDPNSPYTPLARKRMMYSCPGCHELVKGTNIRHLTDMYFAIYNHYRDTGQARKVTDALQEINDMIGKPMQYTGDDFLRKQLEIYKKHLEE